MMKRGKNGRSANHTMGLGVVMICPGACDKECFTGFPFSLGPIWSDWGSAGAGVWIPDGDRLVFRTAHTRATTEIGKLGLRNRVLRINSNSL